MIIFPRDESCLTVICDNERSYILLTHLSNLKRQISFFLRELYWRSFCFFFSFDHWFKREERGRERSRCDHSFFFFSSFIDIILIRMMMMFNTYTTIWNMEQSKTFTKFLRVLQFRKHIKGKIIIMNLSSYTLRV